MRRASANAISAVTRTTARNWSIASRVASASAVTGSTALTPGRRESSAVTRSPAPGTGSTATVFATPARPRRGAWEASR